MINAWFQMEKCVTNVQLDISRQKNFLPIIQGNLEVIVKGKHDTVIIII